YIKGASNDFAWIAKQYMQNRLFKTSDSPEPFKPVARQPDWTAGAQKNSCTATIFCLHCLKNIQDDQNMDA
ncbi:hypothetical protein, partial [Anaerotruncus colihominis]